MKQIIIITILALGFYFAYINWDKINTAIQTDIKNEKTIQTINAVNEGRNNLNQEAEQILNNN